MSQSRKSWSIGSLVLIFALGAVLAAMFMGRTFIVGGRHTPENWVRAIMKGMEIAIKGYKTEYLQLPQVGTSDSVFIESRGPLLVILLGENIGQNARQIRFWDPPTFRVRDRSGATKNSQGDWELRDRWGNFFRIYLDFDGDGLIPNPAKGSRDYEPDVLTSDVIIYSAGKDGDYATWKDNVLSWS